MELTDSSVCILAGARTAFTEWAGGKNGAGKSGGTLKSVSALRLGSVALRGAIDKSGLAASELDHVVFGNALQTSPDAIYGARHVALGAGVPESVPALSVARICGTGIQAVVSAAGLIRLGDARFVAAGGTENLSQAPFVVRGLRGAAPKLKHLEFEDALLSALYDPIAGLNMAQTAENLARIHGVSRQEQDAFALRSCREAVRARKAGFFKEEIVPVALDERKGRSVIDDDHCVEDCTLEGLAALRPAFGKDGCVTAGNASGVVDGACAVVLASGLEVRERRLPFLGRLVSWSAAGVSPKEMGIGPVPAVRAALGRAGLTLADVDLFEINEAFAAQYLAVEKALGLDRDKVNVNGGAIALGHPLAATGTRLILTVLLELRRRKKRYGVASACIGGGQGIAVVVEAA
ncbi:MAG TPA: acetyl-CoA C-acyltransferase [Elusimicrobia bacterium]|nr:MAG: beta-ketoadipyl CoA thiolase [Elusimicrobia bacterium GWA2_66_18]OGR72160.1 MAG: beta-ketoadipyl CoA thiolase [Elusimicrobia bacterium GWC2_65_9]HAZ09348.1 acetyl-CoA C-acyltransferase [Elusimicrobiota bacterium]